jgi:hypothetical protein
MKRRHATEIATYTLAAFLLAFSGSAERADAATPGSGADDREATAVDLRDDTAAHTGTEPETAESSTLSSPLALTALSSDANAAMCAAAVAISSSLGCAAIAADCAAGTFLTVGSLAIPCVLVTALACGAGAGGAAVVAAYCPSLVRR